MAQRCLNTQDVVIISHAEGEKHLLQRHLPRTAQLSGRASLPVFSLRLKT